MIRSRLLAGLLPGFVFLASCGDGGTGPNPGGSLTCSDASSRALAPGEFAILDPRTDGACVRIPAAGAAGAEHLYVALATAGRETPSGLQAPYEISGNEPATASRARLPQPTLGGFGAPSTALAFHAMLRARERALSESPSAAFGRGVAASRAAVPPTVGTQRSFSVCKTTRCTSFVRSTATAKVVGARVAIFVDDSAPTGGYTPEDLQAVGNLFDNYLFPIDSTAFGAESDLDANGVVVVLLTQRVNQLTPNCNSSGSVILGYFFGLDLLPEEDPTNSNAGEVFYGLVPDPTNTTCSIGKLFATRRLPPVFIHEFQHMISFNQHVLLHPNSPSEDTWLNEGLSHFAEELGGRKIPDAQCFNNDCLEQFAIGNLDNAYNYLLDPEASYLIEPGNSNGTLEERGANWLFVRWLADQFDSDENGTNLTRTLVATARTGADNVQAVTGEDFSTLVTQWQMANYLDDLQGFAGSSDRLRYDSWNFRAAFGSLHDQDPSSFDRTYPLVPDSTATGAYGRSGMLRAGSGPFVLVAQPPSAGVVDLSLTAAAGVLPPDSIQARIGLVRIR